MNKTRLFILGICLLLIPIGATAQTGSANPNAAIVDSLFEIFPVNGILKETPGELKSQFSQNPFGMPAADNEKMLSLFSDAFSLQMMLPDARSYIEKNLVLENPNNAFSTLKSDSLDPILGAWNEFYTLQGIRKRIVSRYEIEQDPPSEKRKQLIDSIVAESFQADFYLESRTIIFRSLVSAFNEISARRSLSESQIDMFVENFRSRMQGQIQDEVKNRLLVMFHEVENKSLRNYHNFLKTKSGSLIYQVISEAAHSAYNKASDRFLNSVKRM